MLHTYTRQVVPGLNEALPQGQEAATPAREQENQLGQRKHVTDGGDEVHDIFGELLLQAAQPGLKQDSRDTCRTKKMEKYFRYS